MRRFHLWCTRPKESRLCAQTRGVTAQLLTNYISSSASERHSSLWPRRWNSGVIPAGEGINFLPVRVEKPSYVFNIANSITGEFTGKI
jgi:hypothetical protein